LAESPRLSKAGWRDSRAKREPVRAKPEEKADATERLVTTRSFLIDDRAAHRLLDGVHSPRMSIKSASRKSVRKLRVVEQTAPALRATPPNLGGE
jgi:hypothetical protein